MKGDDIKNFHYTFQTASSSGYPYLNSLIKDAKAHAYPSVP